MLEALQQRVAGSEAAHTEAVVALTAAQVGWGERALAAVLVCMSKQPLHKEAFTWL